MIYFNLLSFEKKIISYRKIFLHSLFLVFVVLLSCFTAFRFFGIDRDYLQYKDFFESLVFGYDGRFELGFVSLSLLVKMMGLSFWALLFCSAFLSLVAKLYLIVRLPSWMFWFAIYFLALYPLHEMTQIRVSIALGFGYLAVYFSSYQKNNFGIIFFSTLAVLFHWTLLTFIPFIIFSNIFRKRSFLIIGMVVFAPVIIISVSLGLLDYLNPQVSRMIETAREMEANPFSSRNVIFAALIILGLSNYNRFPSSILPFFYISVFGLSFWYGMMSIPVFAHRIFELTLFSYFFWIPALPKYRRFFSMTLFLMLSIYLFISSLYLDPLFVSI